MSQAEFAEMPGVSVRTLQDWEQGRRQPSGAAKALPKVATVSPNAVRKALEASGKTGSQLSSFMPRYTAPRALGF